MSLAESLEQVRETMASACARRGRRPESVRLLAATKTVPPERILEAAALGVRLFGENRVQERERKRPPLATLEPPAAEWHLLGPLQSNKAARALAAFSCIESLDSLALAERLSRLAPRTVPVLLEINLAAEPQKSGIDPASAPALAVQIAALPHLAVRGLMAIPPAHPDPEASRRYFAALAELGERVRARIHALPGAWELSMGMSHDFAVAVEEGATLVRLGTALFGARPIAGV
jgi:pyridoxal phosphate enzyme (YggS family)